MKIWKVLLVCVLAQTLVGCNDKSKSGYTGQQPGNPANRSGDAEPSSPESVTAAKQSTQSSAGELLKPIETVKNSIGMDMVLVPAGKFMMGSFETEKKRKLGERRHEVEIKKQFYISAHEVTQKQYAAIMEENPSGFVGANRPVENVSWYDAMEFCRELSDREGVTYRLPTEEEWEYACRAGTTTPFHFGETLTYLNAVTDGENPYLSKIKGPRATATEPVGSFPPNSLGLYDMHGNVAEWCLDVYKDTGDQHILRGGSGLGSGAYQRSGYRNVNSIHEWQWWGFRVVRVPGETEYEIPLAPSLDRIDEYTGSDLIAKFDEAFEKPVADLLPPVVVFPVVNEDSRVSTEGVGLGYLAAYATACIPEQRMNMSIPRMTHVLRRAGIYFCDPATKVDDRFIQICAAAMDSSRCVVPQLIKGADSWTLKVAFHENLNKQGNDAAKATVSEYEETIKPEQLPEIPGLIAKIVLKKLDALPDDDALKVVTTPRVTTAEDIALLGEVAAENNFGPADSAYDKPMQELLDRNPTTLAGWMLSFEKTYSKYRANEQWEATEGAPQHAQLAIAMAKENIRSVKSQEKFVELLKYAPTFRSDSYYLDTLCDYSNALTEPLLTEHILERWGELDSSYSGKLELGKAMMSAGWAAGNMETEIEGMRTYSQWMKDAHWEFKTAAELNPLGWEAYTHMLRLAKTLHQSGRVAFGHFEAATKICPLDYQPYYRMQQWLEDNSNEDSRDLVKFAHICLDLGRYDTRIPDIARSITEHLAHWFGPEGSVRTGYTYQPIFPILKRYHEGAVKNASKEVLQYAHNVYAKFAGYSGHYKEIAPLFEEIDKEGPDKRMFWESVTYEYLRDWAYAAAKEGQVQVAARLRCALDVADFDEAEKQLALLKPETDEEQQARDRYEKTIAIGRELHEKRKMSISGEQLKDICYGMDSSWRASGDKIVWQGDQNAESVVVFPIGLKHARISGLIRWVGKVHNIRILMHTRCNRDPVVLDYYIAENRALHLSKLGYRYEFGRLRESDPKFQLTFGAEEDIIEPIPELTWKVKVDEDRAGGFAFELDTKDNRAMVSISDLQIELLDR